MVRPLKLKHVIKLQRHRKMHGILVSGYQLVCSKRLLLAYDKHKVEVPQDSMLGSYGPFISCGPEVTTEAVAIAQLV